MSASIFISHAGQDLKVANTLCRALEGRGFKCWISGRDILPGENFQVAIVRAIRAARIMLLVFTGNSNNSEEMTKELALASQHRLIVIPLRIEDVTPNEAFSYEFATRQWIDFFADWEAAMDQLSLRISTAIAADPALASGAEAPHAELEHAAASPPAIEPRSLAEPAPPERAQAPAAPVEAPKPAARAVPAVPAVPTPAPVPATPEPAVARSPSPKVEAPKLTPATAAAAVAAGPATAPAAKPPLTEKAPPPAAKPPPTSFAKARQTAGPAAKAEAAEEKKGAPVGLFIGLGVVAAAVLAAGAWFFAPSLLNHPAASPPKPAIAAAKPFAPPIVTPGPAANTAAPPLAATGPAAAAAQAAASAASNAVVATAAPKAPRRHATTARTQAQESSGEVPF